MGALREDSGAHWGPKVHRGTLGRFPKGAAKARGPQRSERHNMWRRKEGRGVEWQPVLWNGNPRVQELQNDDLRLHKSNREEVREEKRSMGGPGRPPSLN